MSDQDQDKSVSIIPPQPDANPFDALKNQMISAISQAFDTMAAEQAKINRAFFDSMPQDQRDRFVQSLVSQDVPIKRVMDHTGKSQPTVNRHKNGKHTL